MMIDNHSVSGIVEINLDDINTPIDDEDDHIDHHLPEDGNHSTRVQIHEIQSLENSGFDTTDALNLIDLFVDEASGDLCFSPFGSNMHYDLLDDEGVNIGQNNSFDFLAIEEIISPNNPYGAQVDDYLLLSINKNTNQLTGTIFDPNGDQRFNFSYADLDDEFNHYFTDANIEHAENLFGFNFILSLFVALSNFCFL